VSFQIRLAIRGLVGSVDQFRGGYPAFGRAELRPIKLAAAAAVAAISKAAMNTTRSIVTIHMASSLDFFIAKEDGTLSWMETSDSYDRGVDDLTAEGVEKFLQTIDCYVMGSRTYELALKLGWPYGDKPTIVLSHRHLQDDRKSVEFLSGDLTQLVNDRLKLRYKNIWLVGGAMLAKEFIRLNLADEIRIVILPIILGDGTPFVDHVGKEHLLHLKDATAYKNGLVELWYEIRKE
jgi:dihydrofolate reductase